MAGYTRFAYVNYDRKDDNGKPGPLGGDAVIRNYGGTALNAPGGYTLFQNHSSAERATLIAESGTNGGASGYVRFTDYAEGDVATVKLLGGGLEVDGSKLESLKLGNLHFEITTSSEPTLTFALGPKPTYVYVEHTLDLPTSGQVYVKFVGDDVQTGVAQVLLRSKQLTAGDAGKFYASPVSGKTPSFSVNGDALSVTFQ